MVICPIVVDLICFEQAVPQGQLMPSSAFNHKYSSAIYVIPFEWTDLLTD